MFADPAPRVVGPYIVAKTIERGGSGVLYRCVHGVTNEVAVVKLPLGSTSSKAALRREIDMLSRLQRYGSTSVVRLVDHDVDDGVPWYAMEHIQGQSLANLLADSWRHFRGVVSVAESGTRELDGYTFEVDNTRPASSVPETGAFAAHDSLPPIAGSCLEHALQIGLGIARALHLIHSEGIVHGDLSPSNVMIRDDGTPVLVDFGASFHVSDGGVPRDVTGLGPTTQGTAGYTAPEQLRFQQLDARCDLYALGCLLFQLLAGQAPFIGRDAASLARQHLQVTAPLLSTCVSGVPPELEALVSRLLAKQPAERIGRARQVERALMSLLGAPLAPEEHGETELILYRPQFVGRTDELSRLRDVSCEVRNGSGALVLVTGEVGVGKTRFINESAAMTKSLGFVVLSGRCQAPVEGSRTRVTSLEPLLPFLQWATERVFDSAPTAPELARHLDTLKPFMGGLSQRSDASPQSVSPHLSRGLVFRAMANLIQELSLAQPLLLVLDDIHWADELTLEFLSHAGRELRRSRALLVAASSSTEEVERLSAVHRAARVRIELERLPAEPSRSLVRDCLGTTTLPEGLGEFLFRHSEGNPLLIGEYLRAIVARGLVEATSTGGWSFRIDSLSQNGESPQLATQLFPTQLFSARVERLSELERAAVSVAAVLGREFEIETFESLSDMAPPVAGSVLSRLQSRQLLEPCDNGKLRFGHDKLREAALELVDDARRRILHRRAAKWLQRTRPRDAAQIGIHWSRAKEPERALPWLRKAVQQANAEYAWDRAEELLSLAIAQHTSLGLTQRCDGNTLGELYEALGDARVAQAKHSEAEASYERSEAMFSTDAFQARARVLRKRARSAMTRHDYDGATRLLPQAQYYLNQAPDGAERHIEHIEAELVRFDCLYFSRRVGEETESLLAQLAPWLDNAPSSLRTTYYVCAAGHAAARAGYAFSPDAVAFAEKGLANDLVDVPLDRIAELQLAMGFSLMTSDASSDQRRGLTNLAMAERYAAAAGDNTMVSRVLTYSTLTSVRLGDTAAVEAYAARALDAAEVAQLPPYVACAMAAQGWACWRRQDSKAESLLGHARAIWSGHPHPFPFRWVALFPLLDVYLEQDRLDELAPLIAELTGATQQRLPEPLERQLVATLQTLSGDSARAARESTASVVRLARTLRYA